MEAPEQEAQQIAEDAEEFEETPQQEQVEQEEYPATEEIAEPKRKKKKPALRLNTGEERNGFVHGLSVGLGIGCIATFVIMWITVFFTPQLPSAITYEAMLAIFIYPLIYLLAVGLIALTAGIVREYYNARGRL